MDKNENILVGQKGLHRAYLMKMVEGGKITVKVASEMIGVPGRTGAAGSMASPVPEIILSDYFRRVSNPIG